MKSCLRLGTVFGVLGAVCLLCCTASAQLPEPISVAFPKEGSVLPFVSKTYVIGAVASSNDTLTINGATNEIYHTGAFIAMCPVSVGTNVLEFAAGTNLFKRTFRVAAPSKPQTAPTKPSPPRDVRKDLGIPADEEVSDLRPAGLKLSDALVMIDPGHGGRDPGAFMPHGDSEKTVNLLQAAAIRDAFERRGIKVVMTRDDDSFPELYDRPRRAYREKATAFISVHHNSTAVDRDPRDVRHTVTYASTTNSLELAKAIHPHLARAVAPVRDAGAQLKSLAVCRNPAVPSCLIEVDFINLPEGEEAALFDEKRRQRVAEAVVIGFLDWFYK